MPHLEDHIDTLSELDGLRLETEKLLMQAASFLETTEAKAPRTFWPYVAYAVEHRARALCSRHRVGTQPEPDALAERLIARLNSRAELLALDSTVARSERSTPQDLEDRDLFHVPVFTAARTMQALVSTPRFTFHRLTWFCYYRILRSLHTPDYRDWTVGGARAGDDGISTAFVTGECVRAILMLGRAFQRTAALFERID